MRSVQPLNSYLHAPHLLAAVAAPSVVLNLCARPRCSDFTPALPQPTLGNLGVPLRWCSRR